VSNQTTSAFVPAAVCAAQLGVCCGLPLLASAGVLGAVAGIGLGSWLVVIVAAAVVVVGVVRWRGGPVDGCPAPGHAGNELPLRQGKVLAPTGPRADEEGSR
jgi:hypothetical protein